MQQGLSLLWVLSASVSLAAWFYLEISEARNRKLLTRRPLSGCEIARQILDRHQFHRTSIHPASGNGGKKTDLRVERLVLAPGVYSGNRLTDLAWALHAAVSHLEASRSFFATALGRVFAGGLLLSWGLILAGFLWGHSGGLIALGQFLFISFFFFSLASLGKEWEIAERAVSEMKGMELGTDERIRMKRLLEAMRWRPLAEMFRAPFNFLVFRWPAKI